MAALLLLGRKSQDGPAFSVRTFSRRIASAAPDAFAFFGAHSSPLGLDYFGVDSTAPVLKGQFLVALHGASKKKLDRGYRVVRVDGHGQVQDLITGFIDHGVVRGRPCDIFKLSENSFLLSDDNANVIYYVHALNDAWERLPESWVNEWRREK